MESMELNPALLERCMHLSASLKLLHGSYDFIEQPDGSMTFLEVNEMGQFLWLEDYVAELPLLSAFAAFSLQPRPDFQFDPKRMHLHTFEQFKHSAAYDACQSSVTATGPGRAVSVSRVKVRRATPLSRAQIAACCFYWSP